MDMNAIFGTEGNISWWQECLRAVVVFAYGLVLVRVAGRRIFGKWAALDIVVSIIVGSNLSRSMIDAPLPGTLLATTAILAMHWILSHAAARSDLLSQLLEGKPVHLARDGKVEGGRLLQHAVSDADLTEALRAAGITDIAETKLVVLEPSGRLAVVKR